MKTAIFSSTVVLTFGLFLSNHHMQTIEYASPTERVLKGQEKKKFKSDRKKWMQEMHQSDSAINWNEQNLTLRRALYQQKKKSFLMKEGGTVLDQYGLGGSWIERGSDNQTGRIKYAHYDPVADVIYAGTGGGNIWKGTLAGNKWNSINDDYRINSINYLTTISYEGNNRLFVIQGSPALGLYTDDEGKSWKDSKGFENAAKWGWVKKTQRRSDGVIFTLVQEWDFDEVFHWGRLTTLYRSDDNGENFNVVISVPKSIEMFDFYINEVDEVHMVENNELFRVEENGSYVFIAEIMNERVKCSDRYVTGRVGNMFSVCRTESGSEVYVSENGGNGWRKVGVVEGDYPFSANSLMVSMDNPGTLYLGGVKLFRINSVVNEIEQLSRWEDYYSNPRTRLHADIPAITSVVSSGGVELYLVSTDGGLYVSYNNLNTVLNISLKGLRNSQYYGTYTDRINWETIVAGSQDQGVQLAKFAESEMLSFEQNFSGDYGHVVSSNKGKTVWMVYPGFLLCYPDLFKSKNFITWDFNDVDLERNLWMPPIEVDPGDPYKVYLGGGSDESGAHLYEVTLDIDAGGLISRKLSYDFSAGDIETSISAIAVSPIANEFAIVMTNKGSVYRTVDNGVTWERVRGFKGPDPKHFYGAAIAMHPIDPDIVTIGGSGYSNSPVYESRDGGITFSELKNGLPETLVHDLEYSTDGLKLFAATEVGAFVYVYQENRWINLEGPDQIYWNVEYLDGISRVRFATFGRGIWDYALQGSIKYGEGAVVQSANYETSIDYNYIREGTGNVTILAYHSGDVTLPAHSDAGMVSLYDISGALLLQRPINKSEPIVVNEGLLVPGSYVVSWK